MKVLSVLLAVVGLFLVTGPAWSGDRDGIEQRIQALVPGADDVAIAETPIPGLMEVRIRNEIIYMSDDGRYLVQGRMVDLDTQTDLTDVAKSGLRREQLANLDRAEFVSFGPQDAEFEILVFTDPDCGYCRRLHEQMSEYNQQGIRVHYLAFPRAGIGSETHEKMVSIWCAEDQQGAMDIAKSGRVPPKNSCENPVEEQYQLGQSMGVTGTPSMMTFAGDMIPGYVPPAQLRERLERISANGSSDD